MTIVLRLYRNRIKRFSCVVGTLQGYRRLRSDFVRQDTQKPVHLILLSINLGLYFFFFYTPRIRPQACSGFVREHMNFTQLFLYDRIYSNTSHHVVKIKYLFCSTKIYV